MILLLLLLLLVVVGQGRFTLTVGRFRRNDVNSGGQNLLLLLLAFLVELNVAHQLNMATIRKGPTHFLLFYLPEVFVQVDDAGTRSKLKILELGGFEVGELFVSTKRCIKSYI